MGRASQKFDQELFTLKLSELSSEMQIKSEASDRKAGVASREGGGSFLLGIVDGQLGLLRDGWLKGVDRIAREVWQTQGEAMTADLVRDVLVPKAMTLIAARESAIKRGVTPPAPLTRLGDPHPAQRRLAKEIRKLKEEIANRYEIEARTLEHKKAPTSVTKAPAPATPLGGLGLASYRPKPTRMPPNPPTYFPGDLWPQTNVILLEACRMFPFQTQTLELCKHVVAEMTPLFCDAVKTGKMSPDQVQREHGGGMEDLLHSLLVYNDSGPRNGFAISDIAFRLGEKVRESDEWLALAKAIASVQHNSAGAKVKPHSTGIIPGQFQGTRQTNRTGESGPRPTDETGNPFFPDVWSRTDHLRTDAKQAEHPRTQTNANSAQDVESKPPNAATVIGRNINRLRKECGWSLDKLAEETRIDKKLILSHVNKGATPVPRILKEYAQAFSKALERRIIAPDLEK